MSGIISRKVSEFIAEYFIDIDFDFQGSHKKKAEDQIMALKYEYFVNAFEVYSFKKEIDIEDTKRLSTGTLRGIDSVFLILNGKFFAIPEENDDDYAEYESEIDLRLKDALVEATFYFNQIKSNEVSLSDFVSFCDAVYDTFDMDNKDLLVNNRIKILRKTYDKIANKTEDIKLHLKFCSMKKDVKKINELELLWKESIAKKTIELKSTRFKQVIIKLVSGQDYMNKLNNFNSPNKRKFEVCNLESRFKDITIENTKTYFGYLNMNEVLMLLKDEDGNFDDNNVFFDNIRYFQGDTIVNSKILKSLNTNGKLFHTLHNGIIITSTDALYNAANGNLILSGFSIVNGCQTCNMIWKWHEHNYNNDTGENRLTQEVLESYKIPVKIVITPDNELKNKITEAANTQNQIKSINLIAISDVAKSLEKKILDLMLPKRKEELVFQRLPKYDETGTSVLNISLEDVARAFYSTFGQVPHEISRSFGKYLESKLNSEDFLSDKSSKEYDIDSYMVTSIVANYMLRFIKSRYYSLVSLRNHFLLLFFILIDKEFLSRNYVSLDKEFVKKTIELVDDKDDFEKACSFICDFAKENLDIFIDNTNPLKPKVIPKSYYSEENTKKMVAQFIVHRSEYDK